MLRIEYFSVDDEKMKDFEQVFQFLYKNDPIKQSASFINESENDRCFVVYSEKKPVARAAAMFNENIQYKGNKTALIGYFECIEDIEISTTLFNSILSYISQQDFEYCLGPLNGNTWQSYRITKPSSNPNFFLDNYHLPYYYNLFSEYGWHIVAEYETTRIGREGFRFQRLDKYSKQLEKQHINIRPINLNQYESELKKLYEVSIESFANNLFYSPIDWQTFYSMYVKLEKLIESEYVLIAESSFGEPLAFVFALSNRLSPQNKSLVIKTIAIKPTARSRGLGSYLVELIHKKAFDDGYEEILHALMFKDNISTKICAKKSEPYREYVLMGKPI